MASWQGTDSFNLNRDARPLATGLLKWEKGISVNVSISTEMPGPWRHLMDRGLLIVLEEFQSQPRCQAPGDEKWAKRYAHSMCSFNLNRDARPLATMLWNISVGHTVVFQSQPRCQAPGDGVG